MAVSSNSIAMPERKPMGRRTLMRGAAALAPLVAFSALPAPAAALSRTDLARRIQALAAEMSTLLADLDNAMWEVRVSPTFRGAPMFSVEPQGIDPQTKLDRNLSAALRALNDLRPGHWRREIDLQSGFIVIVNDDVEASSRISPATSINFGRRDRRARPEAPWTDHSSDRDR